MEKILREALFFFFVLVLVYAFFTELMWLRIVCIIVGLVAATVWIGWDWFVAVLRHGRTFRG